MTFLSARRGFTLIELLVVIAIIGILASIILASLATARSKGTDAARIEDVKSLENAMELYYDDNKTYPSACTGVAGGVAVAVSALSACLVPNDIASIPSLLISDNDQYVWGSGAYAIKVVTSQPSCKTGQNVNPAWWVGVPSCSF